jgi:hypothetical protein
VRPGRLVPRTLDLLILKGVSLGPRHGYGILLRVGVIVTSSWPEPHVYKNRHLGPVNSCQLLRYGFLNERI